MKTIRNLGCLGLIVVIVFILMAAYSGGEQFREWGAKVPVATAKKYFEQVAQKADSIKKDIDKWQESVGRSTGAKKKYE